MRYLGTYFSTYPWHSINIVPHASWVMTYDDSEVPHKYGSMIELCLFGQVFHVHLPIILKRSYSTEVLGPLWSKRRKVWYTVPLDELK